MGLFVTQSINDTQYNSIKYHYVECRYAECHFLYYTEFRYAECHGTQTAAKGVFTQVILQLHIVDSDLRLTN